MTSTRVIAEAVTRLASSLPTNTAESVAEAILTSSGASLKAEIARRVAHHHHRDLAHAFVDHWRKAAPDLDAQTVSAAILTAALCERVHRDSQSAELVWTGPDTSEMPFRKTEQAILQLLDSAQKRITLVSFAVYRIPHIADALVRAAQRGVELRVIVETPDKLGGENEYSTLRALGPKVASCCAVYYWPREKRAVGENNKTGILHVKCAVADGSWLLLSSANLTQQAFTINMELGILVRGGTMPMMVEKQFDRLIEMEALEPL